jgi:hypothetical protein
MLLAIKAKIKEENFSNRPLKILGAPLKMQEAVLPLSRKGCLRRLKKAAQKFMN